MRLRELKYPICVLTVSGIIAGQGGGLRSPRRWNLNIKEFYLDGSFDGARIWDSTGCEFRVQKIYFRRPSGVTWFIKSIMWPGRTIELFDVDMDLVCEKSWTLDQLRDHLVEKLTHHKDWWSGGSFQDEVGFQEIKDLIDESNSFESLFDSVGGCYRESRKSELPKGGTRIPVEFG